MVMVECAAVSRAASRRAPLWPGAPQLTTRRCPRADSSNDSAPAWASCEKSARRRRAHVHDEDEIVALQPLIARMGRVEIGLRARVVIGEHGRKRVGLGDAHAVEQRER